MPASSTFEFSIQVKLKIGNKSYAQHSFTFRMSHQGLFQKKTTVIEILEKPSKCMLCEILMNLCSQSKKKIDVPWMFLKFLM